MELDITIQNVVATAQMGGLDLDVISKELDVPYPTSFPGIVVRNKTPRATMRIFKSGSAICVGAASSAQARQAIHAVYGMIKHRCTLKAPPDVTIQNVVATANMGRPIDMMQAISSLSRSLYEPEMFPGMIYRMEHPRGTILLFASGRAVCVGASSEEGASNVLHELYVLLDTGGLFRV